MTIQSKSLANEEQAESALVEPAAKPSKPTTIWFNGELVPTGEAAIPVFDHGLLYGDGVFEGIRVYNARLFKVDSHLRRLFASAKAIRLEIPYTESQLIQAIRDICQACHRTDAYIRLCVTRGEGTLGLNPFKCTDPNVFIIAGSIELYPERYYDQGISVITAKTIRNHPQALSPTIKSMNYLNNIQAKIEAIDAGAMEAVMLNHEGNVAECSADNLLIVRDGVLVRPPLSAGMLDGVTMKVLEQLAREADITVQHAELSTQALYEADEMLLTGTGAEVMPVTRMDDQPIGDGTPGPITTQLRHAFHRLIADHAPED